MKYLEILSKVLFVVSGVFVGRGFLLKYNETQSNVYLLITAIVHATTFLVYGNLLSDLVKNMLGETNKKDDDKP